MSSPVSLWIIVCMYCTLLLSLEVGKNSSRTVFLKVWSAPLKCFWKCERAPVTVGLRPERTSRMRPLSLLFSLEKNKKKTDERNDKKTNIFILSTLISASMKIIHKYSASKQFPSTWEQVQISRCDPEKKAWKLKKKIIQTRSDDCLVFSIAWACFAGWRILEISLSLVQHVTDRNPILRLLELPKKPAPGADDPPRSPPFPLNTSLGGSGIFFETPSFCFCRTHRNKLASSRPIRYSQTDSELIFDINEYK